MIKPDFSELIKQAQDVQQNIQKMQEELKNIEVTGESGAGLVKVTMNGKHQVNNVNIDDSVYDEEKTVLEDLVAAACNNALQKVEREHKSKMSELSGGMNLSSMLNPFK